MARTARFLLYALLIWAPLPLASNRAIVWVVNGLVAALILCIFLIGEYTAKSAREVDWRPAAWTLAGITVWTAWMVIQALPIAPPALHHPVWSYLGSDIPGVRGAISVNPTSTWTTIAEFVPMVLLGLVSFRLAMDHKRARTLLAVVVFATTLVALVGLISFFSGFEIVSLLDTAHYEGYLTATFVGRAAAASYFAIGIVAAAALIAGGIESARTERGRPVFTAIWDSSIYILAFLVLLVALLETGSRGGLIAAVVGLLVVVALAAPPARGFAARAMVVILVAAGLAVLMWLFGERLFERLSEGVGDQDRLMVYRETIQMILARPILGHGAGTFGDVYPMFQGPGDHNLVWLRTHSTYLQAAAELGIPIFAVTVLTLLFVLGVILRGLSHRTEPAPAALAALGVAVGLALQSAIDFSVQLQAVALTVVVLLGAGMGEAIASRRRGASVADRDKERAGEVPGGVRPQFQRVNVTIPTTRAGNGSDGATEAGMIPDGRRVYVFGDLHGRLDLLIRLREAILRDRAKSAPATVQVIGLGDFIDRGPESRQVIETLMSDTFECSTAFIRGNHEQMLLDFLEGAEAGPMWVRNGAMATLQSYGVDVSDFTVEGSRIDYQALQDAFRRALPEDHAAFYTGLPLSLVVGGYFFVHAGARPGIPLHLQKPSDLLWIREGFVDRDAEFERIVVHGHTPVEQPYLGKYRINLDTGAYLTNRLTCLVLETRERRILEI